jgi:hypothetical protein
MNDMTTRTSGAVALPERNVFEAYSEAANGNRIVGDFLKFSKGDWLFGRNADEMDRGTRLVANVLELKVGWQRWEGGKPTDSNMGRVMDAFIPPVRASLGDNDKDLWERDEQTGQPRDPWQLTNTLILKAELGDDLYTFSTSSKGGIGAIGKLAGEFGKHMRARPNELPVVALEVDSYAHPNKALGRIKTPVFKLVGWTDKSAFEDALAADAAAAEEAGQDDDLPFEEEKAPPAKGKGKSASSAAHF